MLLCFGRLDAFGVALVEGLLDFGAHLFLDSVAQPATAVLQMLDQRMNVDAVRVEQTLQSEYGGDDFPVAGRNQPADDIAQT